MPGQTTLTEAIADARSHIDDTLGRRWTDAQVTRALHSCVSSCIEEYAARGGERFDEDVEVDTDASGEVELLTYDPLTIRSIVLAVDTAGWTTPIDECDAASRGMPDLTERTLKIRLVKRPPMPEAGSDLLVGVTSGAMRSWPAFDRWVCMRAAQELGTKDDKVRAALDLVEAKKRTEVMSIARIPKKLPWPRARNARWWWDLRWLWTPRTAVLSLHQAGR